MISTKQFEGLKLTAYRDTEGKWTIGYGHNLNGGSAINLFKVGLNKTNLLNGDSITQEQADQLYNLDMDDVRAFIKKLVPDFDELDPVAQAVLLDLGFNMGYGTLSQFHNTLQSFINKDYSAAADGLEASRWYGQVRSRGVAIVQALRDI